MHGFWTVDGNRESLRHKGFASTETKRARSANPTFWQNGPRGSTDRPLQSFCIKPVYKPLADHPSFPSGPLNHGHASDYRTNASLSTYPFRWRESTRAEVWAPRQTRGRGNSGGRGHPQLLGPEPHRGGSHPGELLAGWDHAYTHQNTHFATTNFQYGSFWFEQKLKPHPAVFNQTQAGPGWYGVGHGTRP